MHAGGWADGRRHLAQASETMRETHSAAGERAEVALRAATHLHKATTGKAARLGSQFFLSLSRGPAAADKQTLTARWPARRAYWCIVALTFYAKMLKSEIASKHDTHEHARKCNSSNKQM